MKRQYSLSQKQAAVVALSGFVLLLLVIYARLVAIHFGVIKESSVEYQEVAIHNKVFVIPERPQGVPLAILDDGRKVRFQIGGVANEYLLADDSVVKKANTRDVTIYRTYPDSTVVSVFGKNGHLGSDYSGLISRRVVRR